MSEHFNDLSAGAAERLALLLEELGEAQQAIGKILRHGYESHHPNGGPSNRAMLCDEIADVRAAVHLMTVACDLDEGRIRSAMRAKFDRVGRYLHHQPLGLFAEAVTRL